MHEKASFVLLGVDPASNLLAQFDLSSMDQVRLDKEFHLQCLRAFNQRLRLLSELQLVVWGINLRVVFSLGGLKVV